MPRISDTDLNPGDSGRPDLGPSDSSDSASDLPFDRRHTDSDSQATGERESVEPDFEDDDGADVATDRITDADEAGISRDAPDPVRNGG